METIRTSSRCWGYSKIPKNRRRYYREDAEEDGEEVDIFWLIVKNTPSTSRELTAEEVMELGLSIDKVQTDKVQTDKVQTDKVQTDKVQHSPQPKLKPKPMNDSSISYI